MPWNCLLHNKEVCEDIGISPFYQYTVYPVFTEDTLSRYLICSVYLVPVYFARPEISLWGDWVYESERRLRRRSNILLILTQMQRSPCYHLNITIVFAPLHFILNK